MVSNSLSVAGLKKDFYILLSKYPKAKVLVQTLERSGDVILFGGVIREYIDSGFGNMPRDFDLVFKKKQTNADLDHLLSGFYYKKNRFGGYKLVVDSLEFDIWEIEDTWAFKEEKVKCQKENYSDKLHETVFLNIDSIVYNLNSSELYDELYNEAMEKNMLDIVLSENPYKELNLLRAILFKRKYNMNLSKKLAQNIVGYTQEESQYLDILYNTQFSHYNKQRICKGTLNEELNSIVKETLEFEY